MKKGKLLLGLLVSLFVFPAVVSAETYKVGEQANFIVNAEQNEAFNGGNLNVGQTVYALDEKDGFLRGFIEAPVFGSSYYPNNPEFKTNVKNAIQTVVKIETPFAKDIVENFAIISENDLKLLGLGDDNKIDLTTEQTKGLMNAYNTYLEESEAMATYRGLGIYVQDAAGEIVKYLEVSADKKTGELKPLDTTGEMFYLVIAVMEFDETYDCHKKVCYKCTAADGKEEFVWARKGSKGAECTIVEGTDEGKCVKNPDTGITDNSIALIAVIAVATFSFMVLKKKDFFRA